MSDHDALTGSTELLELRDSLVQAPLPGPPSLASVMARGRTHRRRVSGAAAGLSVAAAAGTALALSLSGAFAHAPVRADVRTGMIRTAAFTIVTNANGTDTLTINPGQVFDASAMQSALAQHGIPAEVTTGSFCSSDPTPAGFSQVVTGRPAGPYTARAGSGPAPTLTIDPSAMPAGAELSLGDFQLASGQLQADMALITTGSYTCSSTPPGPTGPDDGLGILYGGHTP